MTITIELTPEEEKQLREKAARQRQEPEGVLHGLVHHGLFAPSPEPTDVMSVTDMMPVTDEAHERLVRRLLETGRMTERPARPGQTVPFRPITVQGRPVSETIIEERR